VTTTPYQHCPRCGSTLEPDLDFCTNCGEPRVPYAPPPPAPYRAAPDTARLPNNSPPSQLPVRYEAPPHQWMQPVATPAPLPYAPQYYPPGRRQVSVGLCVLVSFLWTGAGFFFIPDRVATGLVLVLCTLFFVVMGIAFTGLTAGFGGICVLPLALAWWFGILIWTYRSAERYNRGA
jgi:hypothetical protein